MFMCMVGIFCVAHAAPGNMGADTWWVELGATDRGRGLRVSSQPDGCSVETAYGGRQCRQTDVDGGSTYFYFDVDEMTPPETLFVSVDFFDRRGVVSLDFDAGEGASAYRQAPESYPQQGTRRWRTETFTLRAAQFKNRQNGGNDFRIHADGPLAVARVSLSTVSPAGFKPSTDPLSYFAERPSVEVQEGMTIIQQWQIHEAIPDNQLADSAYEVAKDIGITSLQSYVGWAQFEPEEGKADYSLYDPVVEQLRKHELKWLPFLITAPRIATPKWFRDKRGVSSVCLEHGIATPIQSIWNPALREGVRRFLELFQAHYEPGVIEALNLGISGNWGESIVVAGGGFDMKGRHSHLGWWCGDQYARKDWRRWVRIHYKTLAALNAAWNTTFTKWAQVEPFIPASAPSRRAAADLFAWYTRSMTDYAEFWVRTARELFPDTPIYLCTGGHGQPELAADFAAQARMCARYGAGIRITNQSDDGPGNFSVTRMVSSATRLYGGYYTTEPGGANTTKGIAARIFDALSGGASGLYFKTLVDPPDRPSPTAIAFAENARYLVRNRPRLTVAALIPNSSLVMDPSVISQLMERTQVIRDIMDFEFIDENMVADGLLRDFRCLMVVAGDTVEEPVLDALGAWIRRGGVLVLPEELAPLRNVDDRPVSWWPETLPPGTESWEVGALGDGQVIQVPGTWPEWRHPLATLLVSSGKDVSWSVPLAGEPLDGVYDGVLATRASVNEVYYYNNGDEPVRKEIPGQGIMTVPPRGILAVEMGR